MLNNSKRLEMLFNKFFNDFDQKYFEKIGWIKDDKLVVDEFKLSDFKYLRQIYVNPVFKNNDYLKIRHNIANKKLKEIKYILKKFKKNDFTHILDIGCEDCIFVKTFAKYFEIYEHHCVNVDSWYGLDDKKDCNYKLYNGYDLPYENNSFDVILLFQVLHHVKELNKLIKNIHRVIRKNGLIIIREHNCNQKKLDKIIDIEHFIYELLLNKNDEYFHKYYSKYKSSKQWQNMFKGKKMYLRYLKTPTNYFYLIIQS